MYTVSKEFEDVLQEKRHKDPKVGLALHSRFKNLNTDQAEVLYGIVTRTCLHLNSSMHQNIMHGGCRVTKTRLTRPRSGLICTQALNGLGFVFVANKSS
jgi:hypothetical protein